MVNTKVVKAFCDVKSGIAYKVGDPFLCDAQRAKDLEALGYVEAGNVVEEKPKKRTKKTED